jgi:IS30 family transposase
MKMRAILIIQLLKQYVTFRSKEMDLSNLTPQKISIIQEKLNHRRLKN